MRWGSRPFNRIRYGRSPQRPATYINSTSRAVPVDLSLIERRNRAAAVGMSETKILPLRFGKSWTRRFLARGAINRTYGE